jgi:hypothetical protein
MERFRGIFLVLSLGGGRHGIPKLIMRAHHDLLGVLVFGQILGKADKSVPFGSYLDKNVSPTLIGKCAANS